jgi:hypothetical protein
LAEASGGGSVQARQDGPSDARLPKGEAAATRRGDGGLGAAVDVSQAELFDVRTLLHLQRTLGNQAVAELLARQRPTPVVQRRAESPAADPKFRALTRDVRGKQWLLGAHPPGRSKAADAQAAAQAPPDDREAQAKIAQSGKMAAARPGTFDKAAFVAAVEQAIAAQAPKTLDDADRFASSGKPAQIKGAVQGHVAAGKQATTGAIESTTKAVPDLSVAREKPVTPLSPDRPPGTRCRTGRRPRRPTSRPARGR